MVRPLLIPIICLLPALALADAVDVALDGRKQLGKGLPTLEIRILEPIAGFEVKLQRSDGKNIREKGGGPPGVTRRLQLQQPEGKFKYVGELVVHFKNRETATLPLDFEAELWGPLKMTMEKDDVDIAGRKVRFRANRPVAKAEVEVLMDTGAYALRETVPLAPEPAGTPMEITWPEKEGRVMKISIRVHDESTYFTGVELFPWQVDIPHEEVHFASGKWDVGKDEEAKLEASFKLIADAVKKYGSLANLRLYVAGHTDTVGSSESNRALSVNRAKSLGAWFRKRGLRIPVHYEGFGEQALMVVTADETEEAQNRRAEYIIAVEDPALDRTPFRPSWKKL